MKMYRHQVSQIMISTQLVHDLDDRQFREWPMGFQADRQQIGKYLDQQSRIQAITLQLHRTNSELSMRTYAAIVNWSTQARLYG